MMSLHSGSPFYVYYSCDVNYFSSLWILPSVCHQVKTRSDDTSSWLIAIGPEAETHTGRPLGRDRNQLLLEDWTNGAELGFIENFVSMLFTSVWKALANISDENGI